MSLQTAAFVTGRIILPMRTAADAYGAESRILPDIAHDLMLDTGWLRAADALLAWLAATLREARPHRHRSGSLWRQPSLWRETPAATISGPGVWRRTARTSEGVGWAPSGGRSATLWSP